MARRSPRRRLGKSREKSPRKRRVNRSRPPTRVIRVTRERQRRKNNGRLQLQTLQVFPEVFSEVGVAQRDLDGGLEESQFVAGVIRLALIDVRVQALFLRQHPQTVG